jgi:hypothetical protein
MIATARDFLPPSRSSSAVFRSRAETGMLEWRSRKVSVYGSDPTKYPSTRNRMISAIRSVVAQRLRW